MQSLMGNAGWLAVACFVLAVAGFGAALPGYSQLQFPVALLGAKGFPHALLFNLLAFVIPGTLAGIVAMILRRRLPADSGWSLRIGVQLVFLSALAFISMGLLPLDPKALESDASRLHGTAWMLWTVAFVPGAVLLGAGMLSRPVLSRFGWFTLVVAAGVLLAGFVFTDFMPAGLAQRIAFGLWLLWLAVAGKARPSQSTSG
ncbi:MAG: DUF998 domain-containing protein [Pseudoxanthomonas sp.]